MRICRRRSQDSAGQIERDPSVLYHVSWTDVCLGLSGRAGGLARSAKEHRNLRCTMGHIQKCIAKRIFLFFYNLERELGM